MTESTKNSHLYLGLANGINEQGAGLKTIPSSCEHNYDIKTTVHQVNHPHNGLWGGYLNGHSCCGQCKGELSGKCVGFCKNICHVRNVMRYWALCTRCGIARELKEE